MNNRLAGIARSLGEVDVVQAFDQSSGEGLISNGDHDVAMIDIDLGPDMRNRTSYGGFALLSALAQKRTVTLVISGMPDENLHDLSLALKAYEFLAKPVTDAQVANALRHALDASERTIDRTSQEPTTSWPRDLKKDPDHDPGLLYKGKPVRLSLTEYRLVHRLISKPGEVVPSDELLEELGTAQSRSAVATHLTNIRKRFRDIDSEFDALSNSPGRGYVWKP